MHYRYLLQLVLVTSLLPSVASAYMGPGAGLGMLGSLLAISALGLATITGLLLYPITLLRERLRGPKAEEFDEDPEQGETGGDSQSERGH